MKINIDTKKGTEAITNMLTKASDAGKKAALDVQNTALSVSEKVKQDSYTRRLKKYNPLFWDIFNSNEFNIPNMIIIVDDAVRRGIDVCEGAIGWLENKNGMEVLYLYDEAVEQSKLRFIPSAACDAIYFVDNFDRRRFIRTDCIFSKAHEERLAELKHVAHSLGARRCSIEINESSSEVSVAKKRLSVVGGASIHGVKASSSEKAEQDTSARNSTQRSGRISVEFEGCDTPKKPKLKWFANDENIKKLIEIRCKGDNSIKYESLELSGATSATMSQKTAYSIDNAIGKMGIKGNSSMESQAIRENTSTLTFCVEF